VLRIYHLIPRAAWQKVPPGPYRAASLAREGFVHCSNKEQVAASANKHYPEEPELLLLCLDPERMTSLLRDEEGRSGELFPHIYGPINREAIVEVIHLERGADGRWVFE
jgi:uncharacterized protein (DUF952 family)